MVKIKKSSEAKSLKAKPTKSTSLVKKSKQEAATSPKKQKKKGDGKAVAGTKEKSSTQEKVKPRKQENRKSVTVAKKPKKDNEKKSTLEKKPSTPKFGKTSAQEKKDMQPPSESERLCIKIKALERKQKQTNDPKAIARINRLIVRAKYHLASPSYKKTLKRTPAELSAYLNAWKNDRENWKYNRQMQTSVQKLIFDVNKIDAELFPTAVEYLSGSQGAPRDELIQTAKKIVTQVVRSNDGDLSDSWYVRARQVLQCLE